MRITVSSKVQPGSLSISGPSEVANGKSVSLTAEFTQDPLPENRKLTWESSDQSVASVNSSGKVTGVTAGTAVIKACSQENETVCAAHTVKVLPVVESIDIEDLSGGSKQIDLASGNPYYQLKVTIKPDEASQTVVWESNSPSTASVDENGKVTGLRPGTTLITVKTTDGSQKSASVRINVVSTVQQGSLKVSGPDVVTERKSITLSAVFTQDPQPTNTKLKWESSDESVAKVNSSGTVTGVNSGSVEIKVCSDENSLICATHRIYVSPLAKSLTVTDKGDGTLMIDLGAAVPTYQLSAEVLPTEADQNVTWNSSSAAVASVDENGLVTGHRAGTATITASAADGSGKRDSVKITVGVKVKPGSLSVSGPSEVAEKKTIKLEASFTQDPLPSNTGLTWVSSDESIAKVYSSGTVTGVSKGEAKITVCAQADSSMCAVHTVTVKPIVKGLLVYDKEDAGLEIDLASNKKTYQLGVLVDPLEASQNVNWKSSSPSVAEVDENGLVTAVGRSGTATITATAVDGSNRGHSIRINVKAKVQPGSVRINKDTTHIDVRRSLQLSAVFTQTVEPNEKGIVWTTSDPSIARVNYSGVVSGLTDGVVTIRAAAKDNLEIYDEITISVGNAVIPDLLKASAGDAVDNQVIADENHFEPETGTITDSEVSGIESTDGETPADAAAASVTEFETNADAMNEEETEAVAAVDNSETDVDMAETTAEPEVQGPHFGQKEIWMKVGESLVLDVENPDNDVIFVGLGGETDAVLWNDELYMVTSIGEAEVMAFLSTIDPVEIKDMAAIHIVAELPAEEPVEDITDSDAEITEEVTDEVISVTEEPVQAAEPTEAVTPMVEETEVPSDEENTDETNTAQSGSDDVEETNDVSDDRSEPVSDDQAEPAEEVDAAEAPVTDDRYEIRIKDLEVDDDLTGIAGENLTIERERFEMGDDLLRVLVFEIENEAVAVLTERSMEEVLVDGIELQLLNVGETKLLIKLEGVEEPLREIRLVVEAVPTVVVTEEPVETETAEVPEEQVSETPEPTEEAVTVIEETPEPTEEVSAVVEETSEPTEEAAVVIEETPEPTEEPASDIQETSDPVTGDTSGTETE